MNRVKINPVLCIAGPTASGKSAFAIKLAKRHGGEVINADALQVYRDLRVISARPSAEEEAQVPHHMFGHIDGSERYNTGRWLGEVVPVILDVLARGRVPIVIGGTGLYFKALTRGLASIPDVKPQVRAAVANDLAKGGTAALRAEAEQVDPAASARVLGDDPQRLSRIVEVARSSGKPLSAWQADTRPVIPRGYWQGCVLHPERDALYGRINQRFDTMAETGGLEEVRRLVARDLNLQLPVMKAIGVPQLSAALSGQANMSDSIELAKRETRRFAKRQYTWFRNQTPDWPAITDPLSANIWDILPTISD